MSIVEYYFLKKSEPNAKMHLYSSFVLFIKELLMRATVTAAAAGGAGKDRKNIGIAEFFRVKRPELHDPSPVLPIIRAGEIPLRAKGVDR